MVLIQAEERIIVAHYLLKEENFFPNNAMLPVLFYKNVWQLPLIGTATVIEKHFKNNEWENAWHDGIYNYHHYHSTAHEVLGFYRGKTHLQLGGDNGIILLVEKGDALVIPAGVAHKNLDSNVGFKCVGAYPRGQNYDMNYGKSDERPATDYIIKDLDLPKKDPIFGLKGPLKQYWKKKSS